MSLTPNIHEGDDRVPDSEVWYQVSRNHRIVARLPEGKTGIQALIDAETRLDRERWAQRMGEGNAGDHYLRCHAMRRDGDWQQLTNVAFNAFRAAGGDTYRTKAWLRLQSRLEALDGLDRDGVNKAILDVVDSAFGSVDMPIDYDGITKVLRRLAEKRRGT